VSAAHGAGLTLCVVADGTTGTGVAEVTRRTAAQWKKLLGKHLPLAKQVSAETGEGLDTAAARVLAAVESLRDAGLAADAPLTLASGRGEAWAVLASGEARVATLVTTLRDAPHPVVLAVLTEGRP
jgi:enediyne polyketide synthase